MVSDGLLLQWLVPVARKAMAPIDHFLHFMETMIDKNKPQHLALLLWSQAEEVMAEFTPLLDPTSWPGLQAAPVDIRPVLMLASRWLVMMYAAEFNGLCRATNLPLAVQVLAVCET